MEVEAEIGAEYFVAQESLVLGLLDGEQHSFYRQRVFGSDVDIALGGADSVGGDSHPLDNSMGVAFHGAAVHKSPGVALVGVANHVFLVARRLVAKLPLLAGGKAGPSPPPQTGALDLVDNLLRTHLRQYLAQ
ncbi:hypothetical protein ES708_29751 [subsurface metagenome]